MTGSCSKTCTRCEVTHPCESFYVRRASRDGLDVWCKACKREANTKYTITPKQRRARKLKNLYGIVPEDYDRLLLSQGGVCVMCDRPPTVGGHLDIDHNHSTGKVRGLLCRNCNRVLGWARDRPGVLRAGARYLEQNE